MYLFFKKKCMLKLQLEAHRPLCHRLRLCVGRNFWTCGPNWKILTPFEPATEFTINLIVFFGHNWTLGRGIRSQSEKVALYHKSMGKYTFDSLIWNINLMKMVDFFMNNFISSVRPDVYGRHNEIQKNLLSKIDLFQVTWKRAILL